MAGIGLSRRWAVYTLTTLLFLMSQFYRVSMAVITPHLTNELSLTPQQLGVSSAVFFYAFALTQVPIGIYLDRIGARLSMTILTLFGVAGAVIFALAPSFGVLLLGRTLLGIGMACNLMGSLKLITQWFPPHRFATLTALTASLGATGNLLASTPLVFLVKALGWRGAFGLCAVVNLVLLIVFFSVVKDSPSENRQVNPQDIQSLTKSLPLDGLMRLFRMRDYWMISFGAFCRYGVFAAVQALWAGPFLIEVMGYSQVVTGNLLLLLNLGFILGGPISGALSDTMIKSRKLIIGQGLAGLAVVMALLAVVPKDAPMGLLALLFCAIGMFASAGTIMYPHIKELMPPQLAGTAVTGINFFTMAGAAVFLQGLGVLMQGLSSRVSMGHTAFAVSFAICSAFLATATLLYAFFTRETLRRN